MPDPHVLVVGAGAAGLAAALRLTSEGRRVTIVESRDRIGGRIRTIRPEGASLPVELGAEFIHGRSNELWPLVRDAGLATRPLTEKHEGLREGREIPFPDVRGTLERLLDPGTLALPDRPLSEVLRERGLDGEDPASLAEVAAYVEGFHAADVRRLGIYSLAENEDAEDEDGEEVSTLPDGYDRVPAWLSSRCPPSLLDLHLSTALLSLRWRPGEVVAEVRNPDGGTGALRAPRAIITLPLGVLKAPAGAPGAVRIEAAPTGWLEALRSLEMGAAHRIVLRFETPWWVTPGREPPSFVHGPASAFPIWWASPGAEEPRLTGWCGGPRAASLAGRSHDVVLQAAFDSLAVVFGRHARAEAGRLRGAHHHDWVADPWALGAYSYGGVGARGAREFLSSPVERTLYLAGEALAGNGRNATVHGAIVSGTRAAERALEGE